MDKARKSSILKTSLAAVVLLSVFAAGIKIGWWFNVELDIVKTLHIASDFKQLELVLLDYHAKHGHFPPATTRIKAGYPKHSWRVLLMETMQPEKFAKFDFTQAWDAPVNRELFDVHSIYTDYGNDGKRIANYLTMPQGESWSFRKPMKSYLVVKGSDQFLLVDDPDSTIHWMEPRY